MRGLFGLVWSWCRCWCGGADSVVQSQMATCNANVECAISSHPSPSPIFFHDADNCDDDNDEHAPASLPFFSITSSSILSGSLCAKTIIKVFSRWYRHRRIYWHGMTRCVILWRKAQARCSTQQSYSQDLRNSVGRAELELK